MLSQSNNPEPNSLAGISIEDLEHIINSSSESIISLDLDFKIKYANYSFKSMALKVFDLVVSYQQTSFFDLIPHFLQSHYRELLSNVLRGDTIKNDTYRSYPNRNLPEAYYEEVFMPVRNNANNIISIYVFIRDITQKYKTELQLAENEAILMGVFDSSSDEIISVNKKYEITSFNKKAVETFEKITGKRIFIGTNLLRHFEIQGLEKMASLFKRRFDKGLNGDRFTEMDAFELDGATKYVEMLINPVYINDAVIGISIFTRDVTQKMLSDRKILENDEFLKSVQNLTQIGTWRHNLKSGDFSCSNFCFEIFGIMPTIKPTKALFDGMLGSENVRKMQECISDFLKNGKRKQFEIKLKFSENFYKHLTCFVNPIVSEKGELSEIVYVLQDVTVQKRTQKELDKANEFLNTLMDSIDHAVISINDSGITTLFNKASEKILGYKAGEIIGKHSPLLWHDKEDLNKIAGKISAELGEEIQPDMEVFTAKPRKGLKNEIDSIYITKDGRRVPVQISTSPLHDKKKNIIGYVGIARDVTEKFAFETKLKEQNILLNTIINSLPFDFWARDAQQKMIIQNAKSIEYWGDQHEKEFNDQEIKKEVIDHWAENNKRAFAGETIRNETKFNIRGKDTYIDEIIVPIIDENKIVTGILGINIDINERKIAELKLKEAFEEEIKLNKELASREEELSTKEEELRQSLEELISVNDFIEHRERQISTIFDNSPDIIVSIDKNLCVTTANKPFRDLYFKINKTQFKPGVFIKSIFKDKDVWQSYKNIYAKVLHGETIAHISDHTEDAFTRYVSEEYYSPIRNDYNEITGVAIFIKDITEKVLAEEKTRKTERLFEAVINSSPDLIGFIDSNFIYQYINNATIDFVKRITNNEIIAGVSKVSDVILPENLEKYLDVYGRALKGEIINQQIARPTSNPEKPIVYTDENYYPVYDDNNKIIGVAATIKDVTDKVSSEIKLKSYQLKFLSILNSSTDYIILINRDMTIGAMNDICIDAVKKFYGVDLEMDKTIIFDVLPKTMYNNYKLTFEKVLRGEIHSENSQHIYTNPSSIVYTEEHFFPILNDAGEVTGISLFASDITEKIINQEKISKQEKRFASVINSTGVDGILIVNREFIVIGFNKTYQETMFKNYNVIVEHDKFSIFDLLPIQFHEEYKTIFENVFDGNPQYKDTSHPFQDNKFIHSAESFFPILGEDNKVEEVAVFIRDVTESVVNQQIIKDSELKLKLITNTTNEAYYEHDVIADELIWHGGFEYLLGLKEKEFNINVWENFIHPEDRERVFANYRKAVADNKYNTFQAEYRIIDQSGNIKYLMDKCSFIRNEKKEIIGSLGGIQDVTIIKLQEEKIKKALESEQLLNEELATREEELTINEEQLKNLVNELTELNGKLREKESQMIAIINSTDDYILLMDKDFNLQISNSAFRKGIEKVLNRTVTEGINLFDFVKPEDKDLYSSLSEMVLKGDFVKLEKYDKDTDTIWEEYYNPIINGEGNILGFSAFLRNVTEKAKFQKKIEASEEMLRHTQEIANLGSWKFEIITETLILSDCAYKIYELELGTKITIEFFRSLFTGEESKKNRSAIQEAIATKTAFNIESYYTSPSGKLKYIIGIGNPVVDKDGNLLEYIGTVQDITERRSIELSLVDSLEAAQKLNETLAQREEQLTANEEELRAYVEELSQVNRKLEVNDVLLNKNLQLLNLTGLLSKVGGWEYDVEPGKYYLTDHLYKLFGVKHGEEQEIFDIDKFYFEEDLKLVNQRMQNLLTKGDPYDYELRIKTAKGEKIWIRSIGYADMKNKKVTKVYGALQDITKRKQDQQKLIDSETNLKAIIDNTDFGIWAVDVNYKLIAFNEVYAKGHFTNRGIVPILGMDLFQNAQGFENVDFLRHLHERAFKGEKFYIEHNSNNTIFDCFFSPIKREDGTVRGVAVIANDISERKIIEKQIRASEGKFRALFEKSKVSMMLIDDDNVIDCNEQTLKLFQLNDKSELNSIIAPVLNGSSFKDFASVNTSENIQKLLDRYQEVVFEWTHTKKDGNQLYGEIRITPIEIDGKEILLSQFYDLTERKLAETKTLESENFLNSIIDNIPIGILIIDEFGDVKRMNSATLGLTDIPEDWYLRGGINFLENPFLQQSGATFYFKTALEGGILINEELEIDFGLSANEWNIRDDKAWFLVTVFPIQENNKVKNVVVALIDITADKKNEEKIKSNALELIASNKKMAEYKLMALRSVMNPHFLFNSLNSIQYFIAKNDREQALNYLSLFSKLIRSILNSSIDNSHSLSEEISILRFYTDLETLRFENKFKTLIEIDKELDQENIEIPSLILQPYVENAILHGLYNKKEASGLLTLSFKLTKEKNLLAIIEDNGVGRTEALEIKQASKMHRSVGMLVTEERLELINKDNNLNVTIIDLRDEKGKPTGTRVEVLFNI